MGLASGEAITSTVVGSVQEGFCVWREKCDQRRRTPEPSRERPQDGRQHPCEDHATASCIGKQGAGSASAVPQHIREEPRRLSGGIDWAADSSGGRAIT